MKAIQTLTDMHLIICMIYCILKHFFAYLILSNFQNSFAFQFHIDALRLAISLFHDDSTASDTHRNIKPFICHMCLVRSRNFFSFPKIPSWSTSSKQIPTHEKPAITSITTPHYHSLALRKQRAETGVARTATGITLRARKTLRI